jgi:hypothetical protein
MKRINWKLFATVALASLVLALSIQQQNVAASSEEKDKTIFNHHSHTQIDEKHGIRGNEGSVLNEEDSHFNSNDNTNREGESPVERTNCNSHSIPANDGHSHC